MVIVDCVDSTEEMRDESKNDMPPTNDDEHIRRLWMKICVNMTETDSK